MGIRDRLRGMIGREAPRPPLRVVPPGAPSPSKPGAPSPVPTAVPRPVGALVDLRSPPIAGAVAVPFGELGAWARGVRGPVTVVDGDPLRAAAAAERLAALGLESHWIAGEP